MKKLEKMLQYVRKQKLLAVSVGTLLLLSAVVLKEKGVFSAAGDDVRTDDGKVCVVVDAGHGGSNLRQ